MSSPTMGMWECRHDVDGRDECPDCYAPAPRAADLPQGSVVRWGNRRVRRAGDDDPNPAALWRCGDGLGSTYTDAEIDTLFRSGKAQVLRVGNGQEG